MLFNTNESHRLGFLPRTKEEIILLNMVLIILVSIALISSCGQNSDHKNSAANDDKAPTPSSELSPDDPSDTKYGSAAKIKQYLTAISPIIESVGRIQQTVERALSYSNQQNGQRRGTGQNLSAEISEIRPTFANLLDQFEKIDIPPLLGPLHRDITKLMTHRLAAYDKITRGSIAENAGEEFTNYYNDAEDDFRRANDLIMQVNTKMQEIRLAIGDNTSSPNSG